VNSSLFADRDNYSWTQKFSLHLQSSKIFKTNGQQFFFNQCPNLELVPNELSEDFQRTENWDTGSGQEMIAFFTA
jgi:hypothetical protein